MRERGINHILAPVDLAGASRPALRYARRLAEQFAASVTVLYVDQALALQTYDQMVAGIRYLSQEEAGMLNEEVREFADLALGGVHYRIMVAADDPARAIAEAAEHLDVDLVVMGTHARQGWQHAIEGSVAEAVIRRCSRAVAVVPQHGVSTRRIERILCPVNFTAVAREAAHVACGFAKSFNAELVLVHVADPAHVSPVLPEERFRVWAEEAGSQCSFREVVLHGDPADLVLDCADQVDADLIVIGAQHRRHHETEAVVGTTTERIVQRSPRPILAVVRQVAANAHEEREAGELTSV